MQCTGIFQPANRIPELLVTLTQTPTKYSYHIAVQSKCTINHFEGLNAIESAFSIPFNQILNSGQINALPAYAASTCTQRFSAAQTVPISSKLSNEHAPVLPNVAHT